MNTHSDFDRHAAAWLADGPTELNDRVLDAALREVHLTHQRRRWSAPWRTHAMTNTMRAAAGVAILAIVGVGVLAFNLRSPGVGNGTPAPTSTAASTQTTASTPSPAPSEVAPGILGWTTYTSEVYGFDFGYPDDWSIDSSATREWQAGDIFGGDGPEAPYAETLFTLVDDGVVLVVWRMPVAANADVSTLEGLEAWAEAACSEVAICDDLPNRRWLPMCLGQRACGPALLVPNENFQVAFVAHPSIERVTVVLVGRPDGHPAVLRYGGSVELLKSILTQMDVWTPEPGQTPG